MRHRLPPLLLSARMAQVQVAVMLLTRLPAGQLKAGAAVPSLAQAAWAFGLVGALVGAIGGAVLHICLAIGIGSDIAALLAVAACVLVTGGLHEDGLADVADGFGGGRDLAQKLAIMRDSRIGSYGTLALVLGVGLRVLCLGHLADMGAGAASVVLIGTECASRAGLAVMLRAMPAARNDGLGHMAAGGNWANASVAFGMGCAALGVAAGVLNAGAVGWVILAGALALGQGAVAALALRQIGGQTGDVLGAAQQIGAMAAMVAAVAFANAGPL